MLCPSVRQLTAIGWSLVTKSILHLMQISNGAKRDPTADVADVIQASSHLSYDPNSAQLHAHDAVVVLVKISAALLTMRLPELMPSKQLKR